MAKVTFDYAALYYLNWWLKYDRCFCEAFEGTDKEEQRQTLVKAAAVYRVARNLRIENDGKQPRLNRACEIIVKRNRSQFEGGSLVAGIEKVRDELCAVYKRKELLSLTTKFLWLRFKKPIIIYDRNARQALGTRMGDVSEFYCVWNREYARHRAEIGAVCSAHAELSRYSVDPAIKSPDVASIVHTDWFQERVFDVWLWHDGA